MTYGTITYKECSVLSVSLFLYLSFRPASSRAPSWPSQVAPGLLTCFKWPLSWLQGLLSWLQGPPSQLWTLPPDSRALSPGSRALPNSSYQLALSTTQYKFSYPDGLEDLCNLGDWSNLDE